MKVITTSGDQLIKDFRAKVLRARARDEVNDAEMALLLDHLNSMELILNETKTRNQSKKKVLTTT